jgi:hypothetical protein
MKEATLVTSNNCHILVQHMEKSNKFQVHIQQVVAAATGELSKTIETSKLAKSIKD